MAWLHSSTKRLLISMLPLGGLLIALQLRPDLGWWRILIVAGAVALGLLVNFAEAKWQSRNERDAFGTNDGS